jgi:two-component system chemotaxis response regulator CheB
MPPRIIVIGASSGGVEPLRNVVSQLPSGFPIPVFATMHVPADYHSLLPSLLSRASALPALHPKDGTKIEPAHVYVAPSDHHLLVDDGFIAVKRGPKENGFRPSIDALFRSAAYSYGPGAVGVVLSGAMNDGASGLWSIKRLGGTAVVQEPAQSAYPSMPRSALEYVEADFRGSPEQIGKYLARLPADLSPESHDPSARLDRDARRMALETQIAAGVILPESAILDMGDLSPFTCPECRGTLVKITEGNMLRFRCHTGHGYTAAALLESLTATVEAIIWQATRGSQEVSMLLEHIAGHLRASGDEEQARSFLEKSREINRRAAELHKLAVGQENLSEDRLKHEPPPARPDDPGATGDA